MNTLVAALASIIVTVLLWRTLYPLGSISLLALMPLTGLILVGNYRVTISRRKAILDSVFTETTSVRKFFKGRISASVQSIAVAAAGLFLIAYKGIAADAWEITLAISSIAICTVTFVYLTQRLEAHVKPRHLLSVAASVTVVFVGTIYFILYMYAMWGIDQFPGYFLNEPWSVALNRAMDELPQSSGFVAQFVEVVFALETLKNYAVVNSGNFTSIVPVVYVVYGAIFGYLQVRVVVSVVSAVYVLSRTIQATGYEHDS
ncbi:MAG: hypothetical protein RQ757_11430 [Pseudomonadales bacterium]|nr:hypothetical protein [Pseudomonadales bacterium]